MKVLLTKWLGKGKLWYFAMPLFRFQMWICTSQLKKSFTCEDVELFTCTFRAFECGKCAVVGGSNPGVAMIRAVKSEAEKSGHHCQQPQREPAMCVSRLMSRAQKQKHDAGVRALPTTRSWCQSTVRPLLFMHSSQTTAYIWWLLQLDKCIPSYKVR